MSSQALILTITASIVTVAANLLLRYGLVKIGGFRLGGGTFADLMLRLFKQPSIPVGFILYFIGALIWFRVLSIAEVSSSYPILVGLTFASVTAGAVILFHESLSAMKIIGICVILAGIIITARG
ncbi:MAG: hypothetical protein FJY65_03450 [Calditrichaeota bacterium]|nr:hypothetical protein [Calditrichota bacterium]